MGSALIMGFLWLVVVSAFQQAILPEGKSPACEDGGLLDQAEAA
jgi:hypothetical protein